MSVNDLLLILMNIVLWYYVFRSSKENPWKWSRWERFTVYAACAVTVILVIIVISGGIVPRDRPLMDLW